MATEHAGRWRVINGREWRRAADGVRVVQAADGWDLLSPSGKPAGNLPDAETAMRLADAGQFEPEGVLPLDDFPDDAGLPALVYAIRHLHGLESTWIESVAVHEKHEGKTVWAGHVQVFEVDHPKTRRCYAWSHESGAGGRRKFHAVLGVSPVESAEMAVRTVFLASVRTGAN